MSSEEMSLLISCRATMDAETQLPSYPVTQLPRPPDPETLETPDPQLFSCPVHRELLGSCWELDTLIPPPSGPYLDTLPEIPFAPFKRAWAWISGLASI